MAPCEIPTLSQDVDRRITAHRKAGRLPFAQLGDPAIEVLHFGLDVYAACDAERREIMARRTMTPHGYNESSGGEYGGSRSDTLFSSDHLHRLSRAAVGVERMDRATHEEEAGSLAASGVEAVMERYWEACSVVRSSFGVVAFMWGGSHDARVLDTATSTGCCGMRGRAPNNGGRGRKTDEVLRDERRQNDERLSDLLRSSNSAAASTSGVR